MPRTQITIKERRHADGSVTYHFRCAEGRYTFATREEAEDKVSQINYLRRLHNKPVEVQAQETTLTDYIENRWWRTEDERTKRQWKPSYRDDLKRRIAVWIEPYIGDLYLSEFDLATIESWTEAMSEDGAGIPTIVKNVSVVSAILNHAHTRGYIRVNPCSAWERPKHRARTPQESLTLEGLYRLRQVMRPRDGLAVSLIGICACRQQELWPLTWGDLVDVKGNVRESFTITQTVSGGEIVEGAKSDASERVVEIPAEVRREIAEVYLFFGRPDPHRAIFITDTGALMSASVFNRYRFGPAQREIGMVQTAMNKKTGKREPVLHPKGKWEGQPIPLYTPHDLRDLAPALAIKAGYDLADLKALMGHSSITTTERHYWSAVKGQRGKPTVSIDEQIREARAKVGPPNWQQRQQETEERRLRVASGPSW